MAKLKIEITATAAAFKKYAEDLGYQSEFISVNEDGLTTTQTNPQKAQEYLVEKIKGNVATALAQPTQRSIEKTKLQEARSEAITARQQIENAMTVTIS